MKTHSEIKTIRNKVQDNITDELVDNKKLSED